MLPYEIGVRKESVSPDFHIRGDCKLSNLLLLGGRGGLGGDGLLFLQVCAADLGLLLRGFLLVRLRGFIAHDFIFSAGLIHLRHDWFLRREQYRAVNRIQSKCQRQTHSRGRQFTSLSPESAPTILPTGRSRFPRASDGNAVWPKSHARSCA